LAWLGASKSQFDDLGDEADPKTRAVMLDEGLDILAGLWTGEPFHYQGQHYHIREASFLPRPVQAPRIPIWVGGYWPGKAPFRRAARWDGVFPLGRGLGWTEMLSPDDMGAMLSFVREQRIETGLGDKPFDVVHCGVSAGTDMRADRELARAYEDVGVTWWLEHVVPERWGDWNDWPLDAMRRRIRRGPPRARKDT
jgi:alkanesulfonate monooxygenase SsuD/methylene tetrahydromethanopterin reductase-like flavin-dependent oxidoreductase (luciferase family)